MVVFNPQSQEGNIPRWGGDSRPISDIPADKSTALAITAAGEGLENATKTAETIDQDVIKEKTRAGVDALRGATTAAYESIRAAQVQGVTPDPNAIRAAGFDATLLKGVPSVPDGLQSGLDRAENIGNAKAQGATRANDTLYTGALNSLAKQLRSEYPGHKEFIDEQISKISGKNPANAYMENILSDISRASSNEDSVEKKMMSKAFENFGVTAPYIKAYQAGLPGAKENLWNATYGAEKDKAIHATWERNNAESKGDSAADADLARSQGQQRAASIMQRNFNPVLEVPGLTQPNVQQKLLDDYREGRLDYPSMPKEAWPQLLNNAVAARDKALAEAKDVFNREGYSRRLKDPVAEAAIINNEAQFFQRQIDAINNKDVGTMFDLQRRSKSLQDNANYQAETGPMGDWMLKSKVVKDHLGDAWINRIDSIILGKGYLGPLTNWFSDTTKKIGVPDDVRKDGQVKSLYNDISKARQLNQDLATGNRRGVEKVYDDLVDNVNMITTAEKSGKPKDRDIAIEAVDYTFNPEKNSGIMKQFGRDFTDSQGKFHKGMFSVYDRLTKPDVVDSVWNLKDTPSWTKMKNFQEGSYKILFGEDATKLNGIINDPNMKELGLRLNWDSDNSRMFFDRTSTHIPASVADAAVEYANNQLNALNSATQNLHYMYKKEKSNTSDGIFQMLMGMGLSPNDRLHGDNFPQRVTEAIAASVKREEDIKRKAQNMRDWQK